MKNRIHIAIVILMLNCIFSFGQSQPATPGLSKSSTDTFEEMRLKLNEGGSHYLKWTFLNQVWLRYNDSNTGTTVLGEPANQTFDIGLRRTRIQFFGQLSDHVFFYTQFGQNNFNYLSGQNAANSGNRKFQVFFHDALAEYKFWKDNDRIKIGGGLTITNGLSRFSQPSIGTIMTLDVPVFAQATVDQTDEFSRKLSVYARGQIGKVDYRLILSDPFPVTSSGVPPATIGTSATFAQIGHHKQYQGLIIYNFLDKEPNTTPYMNGTYLGKRNVFNLEAGFSSQAKATWARESATSDTAFYSMNLWSVALFYDAALNREKGTALSAYAGYFNLNYGINYLRYNGIMNPASGITNGPYPGSQGNAFPMFGTGQVVYAQVGYLLKRDLLGEAYGTLMPYASLMSADFNGLQNKMNVYTVGLNWLIKGHTSKVSLDYQSRPVYKAEANNLVYAERKGQLVLQYQVNF